MKHSRERLAETHRNRRAFGLRFLLSSTRSLLVGAVILIQGASAADEKAKLQDETIVSDRNASTVIDAAWQPDRVISPDDGHLQCVHFSEDGKLVSVSGDRLIQSYSVPTGNRERVYKGATDEIIRFDFSPDGKLVAGGLGDGEICVWDSQTTELIARLRGHTDQIIGVRFSPNGRWFASTAAFHDGSIRIWDTDSWAQIAAAKTTPNTNGMFLDWSPDSTRLVSSEYRGGVRLHAFEDSELQLLFARQHDNGEMVSHVTFAPNGSTFVTSSWDRTLRCWDSEDGREVWRATAPKYARCFEASLFSKDGSRIYSVTRDETIETRETQNGTLLQSRRWLDSAVRGFAISPDEKWMATCGHNRQLKLWTLE